MRSLVLSTLAGLAAVAAVAAAPGDARAQVGVGVEVGIVPVQWGPHPDWDGPRRHHGPPPGWGHRPPPPHWGHRPPPPPPPPRGYSPHRPVYVEPTCWRERRWVETPWGREIRHVRICR